MADTFDLEPFEHVTKKSWTELNQFIEKEVGRLRKWLEDKGEEEVQNLLEIIEREYGVRKGIADTITQNIVVLENLHDDPKALIELVKTARMGWKNLGELIENILDTAFIIGSYIDSEREKREKIRKYLRYLEMLRGEVIAKLEDLKYGRRG